MAVKINTLPKQKKIIIKRCVLIKKKVWITYSPPQSLRDLTGDKESGMATSKHFKRNPPKKSVLPLTRNTKL